MTNSEYKRGYRNTRETLENMTDDKSDWLPDHLKKLASNQDPMFSYDHGAYDCVVDFQHNREWKF